MVKLVPIFIFSTLSFAAIDNRKQELPTDLPVKSFKHYNTEEINSLIDFAYARKEDWISNPLTIASYVITKYSWYDKYDLIQVVKESGKSKYFFLGTGYNDDSVEGQLMVIVFQARLKTEKEKEIRPDSKDLIIWIVSEIKIAWRCWRGDNTTTFQGELCP